MTETNKNNTRTTILDQAVTALLFIAIGLGLLAMFVTVMEPEEREPRQKFVSDYSEDALQAALEVRDFASYYDAVRDAGAARDRDSRVGRFTGGPGFYRTEQLILDHFRVAGLEVSMQEFRVPVPVTEICEILDEAGNPLEGISIHPFMPAGLIPIVLPPEGITARLVATDDRRLVHLDGMDPQNAIVTTFPGAGWQDLASAGVQALILQEDKLSQSMRADKDARDPWGSVDTTVESSFPVFYASGPIREFAGQTVTLRCTVRFESRPVRNLFGVLRGQENAEEALVVSAPYDSNCLVPDYAPGAERALSLAALLQLADALAPYRDQLGRDVIFTATAAYGQACAGTMNIVEALSKYQGDAAFAAQAEQQREEHESAMEHVKAGRAYLDSLTSAQRSGRPVSPKQAEREGGRPNPTESVRTGRADPPGRPDNDALAASREAWNAMPDERRTFFRERWKVVAGDINLALRERALQARLDYLRAGSPAFREGFDPVSASEAERKDPVNQHPLLSTYIEAKRLDDRSGGFISLPVEELAKRTEFAEWQYVEKMQRYLDRLEKHHAQELEELGDRLSLRSLFSRYQRTLTLNLRLNSGGAKQENTLALAVGIDRVGTIVEPQVSNLAEALAEAVPVAIDEPAFDIVEWGPRDSGGNPPKAPNPHGPRDTAHESPLWHHAGYQAFTLFNREFVPARLGTPEDEFQKVNPDVAEMHTAIFARALLAMGQGRVPLKTLDPSRKRDFQLLHGSVYAHAGAASLVPSHPMTEQTFLVGYRQSFRNDKGKGSGWSIIRRRGISVFPMMETDPYGQYRRYTRHFAIYSAAHVDAARFNTEGRVEYFKDASPQGQSAFRNMGVPASTFAADKGSPPKPIHVSVFRATPVSFYDHINPQTLKSYRGIGFTAKQGLTAPQQLRADRYVTFLAPDETFYVRLKDGAAGNEEIEETRAFMLNVDPEREIQADDPEIFGRGYLAADTPLVRMPAIDTAASMLRTAAKRLALQKQYNMADPQMLDFQERSKDWLQLAVERVREHDVSGALNAAGTSVAYAINNHPVIRERIGHAVLGIMWYLGLLVPFVLFFEKLVFGFTDIRKQLVASGLVFIVFFSLLRYFHPAFQIVRSPLMILLGFIMLLLTLLVIAMVSGKFKQNIKELRGKEGRVEGADVNRSGVVGSALALGLNNMRRRKVRTGLTCATLVFITFAMICFTSVSGDLVDTEYLTGRSGWNGVTIRKEYFTPIDGAEVANIERLYGQRFPVKKTTWLMPLLNKWFIEQIGFKNLEIPVERSFEVDGEIYAKRSVAETAMILDWNEPMFTKMDDMIISGKTWFPRPPSTRSEKLKALETGYQERRLAMISESMAQALDITADQVQENGVEVKVGTSTMQVVGIFDAEKLNRLQGLDGKSILPVDLNSLQTLGTTDKGAHAAIPEDSARIDASHVLILSHPPTGIIAASPRIVSVSVLFPNEPYRLRDDQPERESLGYKAQRLAVLEYLERTGRSAYYAIDGLSYFGQRKRARTLGGMLELIVPLLIAALTVFNTMRGSVYERREEIYVYNAVGIAPNHVFFMFMAEAVVYAVMGAMMGYILSQGMGRLLTAIGMTGGLNLDYSSIETIWASVAIIVAVLLSTILPARDAALLASPSGVSSWSLPEKDGDVMRFSLPFTFTPHDRLAVVSYFSRWLDSNGEGSSGPFFCAPPEATLRQNGDLLPVVSSTVWLKPFDLGVSQRMDIALPVDEETGEYIAHVTLTRLSGNQESWDRTVKPFLGVVRKQFLNWRATTDNERSEMFEEARSILGGTSVEDAAETQVGENG